jgi:hypothetical protein
LKARWINMGLPDCFGLEASRPHVLTQGLAGSYMNGRVELCLRQQAEGSAATDMAVMPPVVL